MDKTGISGTFEDGLHAGTRAAAGLRMDALRAACDALRPCDPWSQGWAWALRAEACGRIHGTRVQR